MQKDRQDNSAVGWDHHEKTTAHESQKGTSRFEDRCFDKSSCVAMLQVITNDKSCL